MEAARLGVPLNSTVPGPPQDRAPRRRLARDQAYGGHTVLVTAALFELSDLQLPAGHHRCGRERQDGQPCRAWPMALGPACAHHILSEELAAVEQLRARPSAAA